MPLAASPRRTARLAHQLPTTLFAIEGLIDSEEAARRLNVKRSTLYVYVSRGMLHARRADDGRRSLFDLAEVEQLAERSRRGRPTETRIPAIATRISSIGPDGPEYHGVPAVKLARTSSFEAVAEALWGVDEGDWEAPPVPLVGLSPDACIRAAVAVAGSLAAERGEPLFGGASEARRLITTIVRSLPAPEEDATPQGGIAAQLAHRLAGRTVDDATIRAVDAALVLLAENELAPSTLAVRLAASIRTDLYNAVLAGLGVHGGPQRRGDRAFELLEEVHRLGAEAAIDRRLDGGEGNLPGFGSLSFPAGDPRFGLLRELFDELAEADQRTALDDLLAAAWERGLPTPGVGLGLAALAWAIKAPPTAGYTIFTIARTAGWAAHYLEELSEPAFRLRSRAVYVSH